MKIAVVLDSGPVGLLTNTTAQKQAELCNAWLNKLLSSNVAVILPEIIDYELRRELLRAKFTASITELNTLKTRLTYLALQTDMMLQAAAFWAQIRQQGRPTTGDKELDVDVILAAQAASLFSEYD